MTTLATQLKLAIEVWTSELHSRTELGTLSREGKLSARSVALYLESLRYLFRNSQRNLEVAAAKARDLGDQALSQYFARKAAEEKGHELWAIDDLARFPESVVSGLRPSPAILGLVELQRTLIEEHPVCFVAYALWAEYFTVLVGDEWLDGLAASGFDRAHRLRNTADGLASSLRLAGTGAQQPVWDRLSVVAVPVLVLAGDRDAKFAEIGRRLARAIPGGAFATIPGAGHAAHSEQPEATADLIARWLAGSPTATQPAASPTASNAP